jgi:hypothetical protein
MSVNLIFLINYHNYIEYSGEKNIWWQRAENVLCRRSSFLESAIVTEFHATEAYLVLALCS